MITLSPPELSCRVFTLKDGALGSLGHDLELDVRRLTLKVADDFSRVEASFDPTSLAVCKPALSDKDKQKIETTIKNDILKARAHSSITFASTEVRPSGSGYRLSGVLDLHGVKRTLSCDVQLIEGVFTADVTLQQTDFGITPYSVMLGALRVRNDIRVVVQVASKHLLKK